MNKLAGCQTCGKLHHDGTEHHPFNDGSLTGIGALVMPEDMKVELSPMPFDPVLRLALIDAGIITPDQLTAAKQKIHSINSSLVKELMTDDSAGRTATS